MKAMNLTAGVALALFVLLCFAGVFSAPAEAQENHCFTCHTNARELIKITREISELNKDKPGASAETSGEG